MGREGCSGQSASCLAGFGARLQAGKRVPAALLLQEGLLGTVKARADEANSLR